MNQFRQIFVLGLITLPPWRIAAFTAHYQQRSTAPAKSVLILDNGRSNDIEDASDDDDERNKIATGIAAINVLGTTLQPCCTDDSKSGIGTGFYRNGYCATGEQDVGRHTVCVQVTEDFLQFSKSVGNDLSTPMPQYLFPGLKHGDIWCLCAERWVQAYEYGVAPKLYLQATHEKTLTYTSFDVLRKYALDGEQAGKSLHDLNEQRDKLNKLL